jgi:hypothetical protein
MTTDVMTPTAKLRWVQNNDELTLQQWWSNADSVKMGPVHMIKGEWRMYLLMTWMRWVVN